MVRGLSALNHSDIWVLYSLGYIIVSVMGTIGSLMIRFF